MGSSRSSEEPDTAHAPRIGRYEILSGLSTGGMAELYVASCTGPGGYRKFVALKKILPEIQMNDGFSRMFRDEARITAQLSHSNISQVYDLGGEQNELYLAMELIVGLDLSRVLRSIKKAGRMLPVGFSARVIHELCRGLAYAHGFVDSEGLPSPVIHRDVTPKNVMVTFDGHVKIVDFGVALAKGRLERTAAGIIKGTAQYMSPEQIFGQKLDSRSDLYSAGAVLYELLTGQRLRPGKHDAEILRQASSGQIVPPQNINPNVPLALAEVTLRALSQDRNDRYATAREMAEALTAAAADAMFGSERAASYLRQVFRDRFLESRALLNAAKLPAPGAPHAATSDEESDPGIAVGPVEPFSEITEPQIEISTPISRAGQTVLLVDDKPGSLLATQNAIKPEGYRLISCAFPDQAVQLFTDHRPSLVLIALGADRRGLALCRELRETAVRAQPPVLILSPQCSLEDRIAGLDAGADDFVRLPCETSELWQRIRGHLQFAATLTAMLAAQRWRAPKLEP